MRHLVLVTLLASGPLAFAETKGGADANPISQSMNRGYERVKKFIIAAADQMPADQYNFKPTPEVRSFGQLIGHVADAQYMFCSTAKKEPGPKKNIEKSMTTKADLTKALGEAFAYCDAVYAASTDAALTQPIELFGQKMIKFSALDINVAHDNEHYGNIVTYLRLKKLVPPSSAGQ
jgi:uncharacterized damage-inducible protein DinB